MGIGSNIPTERERWNNYYRHSGKTATAFCAMARRMLKGYGWGEREISEILRDIN